jgi:hypothetical protein
MSEGCATPSPSSLSPICLADGKSQDVPHRDFLMIARPVMDIGVSANPVVSMTTS